MLDGEGALGEDSGDDDGMRMSWGHTLLFMWTRDGGTGYCEVVCISSWRYGNGVSYSPALVVGPVQEHWKGIHHLQNHSF